MGETKTTLIRDNKWWTIYSSILGGYATKCASYYVLSDGDLAGLTAQTDRAWRYARALPDRESRQIAERCYICEIAVGSDKGFGIASSTKVFCSQKCVDLYDDNEHDEG